MPYYCTHCKINWASLPSQDDGDESYDYCPTCKNDAHLIEGKEGDQFIFCQITGKVKDIKTGEILNTFLPDNIVSNYTEYKSFDKEAWEKKKLDMEIKEEKALQAYIQVFENEGKEAADKKYFEMIKKE